MHENEAYKILREYFVGKPVKKIQVFGSYARNQVHDNSDIDLVITMEHPVGLFKLAGYKLELENILKTTVDLITEPSLSKSFYNVIKEDLRTVYERD